MKWITRERPNIDRIACPWLIARFIDRDAEFLYVRSSDVLYAWCKHCQSESHNWPPRG